MYVVCMDTASTPDGALHYVRSALGGAAHSVESTLLTVLPVLAVLAVLPVLPVLTVLTVLAVLAVLTVLTVLAVSRVLLYKAVTVTELLLYSLSDCSCTANSAELTRNT